MNLESNRIDLKSQIQDSFNLFLRTRSTSFEKFPIKIIGGIKNGKPTTVEQNSISICKTKPRSKMINYFLKETTKYTLSQVKITSVVSGFMVKIAS